MKITLDISDNDILELAQIIADLSRTPNQTEPKQTDDSRVAIDDEFALKVKEYRWKHGLSQEKLGKMCKVSGSTISAIERKYNVLWASKYRVEKYIES